MHKSQETKFRQAIGDQQTQETETAYNVDRVVC